MFGGAGNDTLSGGTGGGMLFGQSGNDVLPGKGGVDFLFGGSGNDTLTGGDGDDQMFGESGNDRMIWKKIFACRHRLMSVITSSADRLLKSFASVLTSSLSKHNTNG
ncbi:MAG: calcium-binding protein [Methylococcales bacterium]|nr:calcium-binding protein [Methylococcales bacterium]